MQEIKFEIGDIAHAHPQIEGHINAILINHQGVLYQLAWVIMGELRTHWFTLDELGRGKYHDES